MSRLSKLADYSTVILSCMACEPDDAFSVADGLSAKEANCRIRAHWQRIDRLIRHTLRQVTLSDMTRERSLPGEAVPVARV